MKKIKLFMRRSWRLGILMLVLGIGLPFGHQKLKLILGRPEYYHYKMPKNLRVEVDVSSLPPAKAVPILMYHGVRPILDSENTTLGNFINQMEMLKKRGFQTITLVQLEQFLNGEIQLPSKPIVITFDDGRRDSYYSTDDVFNKLGFNAVLFESTNKPNEGDDFYLSWAELSHLLDTGRWEIQAHGRDAHKNIVINERGEKGWYLSSLEYDPKTGLESVEKFETRIKNDYENSISDIETHLGYKPVYFAIPLSDYGQNPISNFKSAFEFNNDQMQKHFRMAFTQANDNRDVLKFHAEVYNYTVTNRWDLTRIQVKNMAAADLQKILESNAPQPPKMEVSKTDFKPDDMTKDYYGDVRFDSLGLHLLASPELPSARVAWGSKYWSDYSVEFKMKLLTGRSIVLVAYLWDNDNYITTGITDSTLFLRQKLDGEEKDIDTILLNKNYKNKSNTYRLDIKSGILNGFLNDKLVFKNIPIRIQRGKVGLKVWDSKGVGEGVLESVKILPI